MLILNVFLNVDCCLQRLCNGASSESFSGTTGNEPNDSIAQRFSTDNNDYRNGRIRCMLSANTNVAVDRVLEQLLLGCRGLTTSGEGESLGWPAIARVGAVARVAKTLRSKLVLHTVGNGENLSSQIEALMRQVSRVSPLVAST